MLILFWACQSINLRYLITTYMWGTLIYLFLRWVIPPYETSMIMLLTINLIFFPFSRIFAHEIKSLFFSNTIFMMTDKAWFFYLLVKSVALGWFLLMTPIFGPMGFLIVLFRVWRSERRKKKHLQQRRREYAI